MKRLSLLIISLTLITASVFAMAFSPAQKVNAFAPLTGNDVVDNFDTLANGSWSCTSKDDADHIAIGNGWTFHHTGDPGSNLSVMQDPTGKNRGKVLYFKNNAAKQSFMHIGRDDVYARNFTVTYDFYPVDNGPNDTAESWLALYCRTKDITKRYNATDNILLEMF